MARRYKNKKSTDWQVFHCADSHNSHYEIVKNVSLSIRLPNLQMKVSTTFAFFTVGENRVLKDNCSMQRPNFVLVAN